MQETSKVGRQTHLHQDAQYPCLEEALAVACNSISIKSPQDGALMTITYTHQSQGVSVRR